MNRFLAKGILLAALSAAGVEATAETRNIRVANWLPPVHHMTATLRAWADELEKASGGELKAEVMKTPLAKPNGQYELAKNGVVDVAWSVAAYYPKRFWKMFAVEVPFAVPTAEIGGVAAWRWYEKHGFIAKDTADTRLLALFAHAPHIYHSAVPLVKLDDFKGRKVRAGGNGVKIAEALGAVPVFLRPGQTHEALARRTIDVTQFPWESVKGFRLAEVTTHHLDVPDGTYAGIFFLTMSPRTWSQLSEAQRAAVMKVSGEWGSRFISRKWDEAEQAGIDAVKAKGNVVTVLSDAEAARMKALTRPLADKWIADADAAGLDGKALMADLQAIVAELRK